MSGHYCTLHNTVFFKTEKMRGYAHPIKDAQGNTIKDGKGKDLWCNEEEGTPQETPSQQVSTPHSATYSSPETDKRQVSIETQNAVTNTCNLWAAGKIEDDSLLAKNVLDYLASKLIIGSHKAQVKASPLVEAAVALGGVVKGEFPNPGAFLNKCWNEHGLQRADVEAIVGPISAEIDLDGAYLCLTTELAERSKRKSA